jgi:hypothetical protein
MKLPCAAATTSGVGSVAHFPTQSLWFCSRTQRTKSNPSVNRHDCPCILHGVVINSNLQHNEYWERHVPLLCKQTGAPSVFLTFSRSICRLGIELGEGCCRRYMPMPDVFAYCIPPSHAVNAAWSRRGFHAVVPFLHPCVNGISTKSTQQQSQHTRLCLTPVSLSRVDQPSEARPSAGH